jgi:alanine transaminase
VADVLKFAAKHKIMVLADEVYQDNVWTNAKGPWKSFKKVAVDLGLVNPTATNVNHGVQLASFHSTSKGFTGECGRRGGYVELCGFDTSVRAELYKLASISLCSNVGGLLMTGLMTNPPKLGDESYPLYIKERDAILASLKRRAVRLVEAFRRLENVTCEAPEGALYIFPQIRLPAAAVAAATAASKPADTFYCLALLDATGIVVVPGSGFGQKDGTWHFRSTILPSEASIEGVIEKFSGFHKKFMDKYRS